MSRRKQIPISMSNSVLKGNMSKNISSSFQQLGEKGIAIYFLLLERMSGRNTTWITINSIINQLDLQRRDKKEIIASLNFLINAKLIFGRELSDDVKNNEDLEFLIETDLREQTYTTFYPNNFDFCKAMGVKCFSLFCVIESFAGTNNQAYCSVETLEKVTGFSNNTIMKYIYVLGELGVFDVKYGKYNHELKRNDNNVYGVNAKGRIDLLKKDINDIKNEVLGIIEKYEVNKNRDFSNNKDKDVKKEEDIQSKKSSTDITNGQTVENKDESIDIAKCDKDISEDMDGIRGDLDMIRDKNMKHYMVEEDVECNVGGLGFNDDSLANMSDNLKKAIGIQIIDSHPF